MLQGKDKPRKHGQNPDWRLTGFDGAVLRELQSDDRAVDRDLAKHRAASRDRDRREGDIAIDGTMSRSTAPIAIGAKARSRSTAWSREASIAISQSNAPITIGAKARSRSRIAIDGAGACDRRRLELGACERRGLVLSLSRTALIRDREQCEVLCDLSLSLSLSLRNSFEVKIGTEIHFRSQSLFFSVNGNQFPKNSIFRTNQIPAFPEKHFRKWFSPKTNTA